MKFFCDDDFDPVTGGPDEWTDEDQKKLQAFWRSEKKRLDKLRKK